MIELDDLKNIWKDKNRLQYRPATIHRRRFANCWTEDQRISLTDCVKPAARNRYVLPCLLLIACVPVLFQIQRWPFCAWLFWPVSLFPIWSTTLKKIQSFNNSFLQRRHQISRRLAIININPTGKYLKIYFWGSLLLTPVSGFLSGFCHPIRNESTRVFAVYFDVSVPLRFWWFYLLPYCWPCCPYPVMKWWYVINCTGNIWKIKDCLKELEETE